MSLSGQEPTSQHLENSPSSGNSPTLLKSSLVDGFIWFEENWFSLIQTIGIVAGFLLAARSLALDRGIRKTEILIQLTESHREIWEGFLDDANLDQTLSPSRNLESKPVTFAEQRFVISIILHMALIHRAAKHGVFKHWSGLERDICEFLSLPVPAAVFSKQRPYQEPEFLAFVDQIVGPEK